MKNLTKKLSFALLFGAFLFLNSCVDKCKDVDCMNGGTCNSADGSCECTDYFQGDKCETELRSTFYGSYTGTTSLSTLTVPGQVWQVSSYTSDEKRFKITTAGVDILYCELTSTSTFRVISDNASDATYNATGSISASSLSVSGSRTSTSGSVSQTLTISYSGTR